MNAPLDGVRVLELGSARATAVCGNILADLGADVLLVTGEEPGSGAGVGKRIVTIALHDRDGVELLHRLITRCNVIVTALGEAELHALDLDRDRLEGLRPGLVFCAITPFGSNVGADERPATDLTLQALSGVISLTGHSNRPPVPNAFPIADLAGGVYATCAVLAAVVKAERIERLSHTPIGSFIDLSQLHCMAQLLGYTAQQYLLTGDTPGRVGSGHHSISPYEAYPTSDGWMVVCAFTQSIWLRLLSAMSVEHLADDPRFADLAARKSNQRELNAVLCSRFAELTVGEWIPRLLKFDVPAAPVATLGEALSSPFVKERGMVITNQQPDGRSLRTLASPLIIDGVRMRASAPGRSDVEAGTALAFWPPNKGESQ